MLGVGPAVLGEAFFVELCSLIGSMFWNLGYQVIWLVVRTAHGRTDGKTDIQCDRERKR